MAKSDTPIPDGYHTVTPHIVLDDCAKAIEFYGRAFGAEKLLAMPGPMGKIVHAEIKIGDSIVMMSDEMPPMPGQPGVFRAPKAAGLATSALFLYVRDADAAFDRAVKAGCTVRQPLADMFWGDRWGQVIDPFGHAWAIATHLEDLSPEEIGRRGKEFMAKMAGGKS
jgi:PhnB protein